MIVASALWLYRTHFYYDPGAYSIGVHNGTSDTTFRDVSLRVEPRGEFVFGIEDPGQTKWFENPRWPPPTRVFVTFTDPAGVARSLTTTGAPPTFRGSICVVVTKSNDYTAHLELERRK